MLPKRIKLPCGAMATWSVPLSGFGHVADEQPMPFITYQGIELTPRFGGEEGCDKTGIASLPLPWGKLSSSIPIKQYLFNLGKRRVNIYWRNIFKSEPNVSNNFYFLHQLSYREIENGFLGYSPMLDFKRIFSISGNKIKVDDYIKFKATVVFEYFNFAQFSSFVKEEGGVEGCIKSCDQVGFDVFSSSGNGYVLGCQMKNKKYYSGDYEEYSVVFDVEKLKKEIIS